MRRPLARASKSQDLDQKKVIRRGRERVIRPAREMGRRPCCVNEGLNRGAWNAREDKLLINYIKLNGEGNWRDLPQKAGLKRCGKSCRLRWLNYLKPDIKRGNISVEEEELIVKLHKLLGNRWSLIAGRLPGRTDNEIKNYWNTNLSKRVAQEDNIPRSPKKKHVLIPAKHKDNMCDNYRPHQVIRTKAVRCTRVVNILPPRPVPLYTDKIIDNSNSPEGYVGSNGGSPNNNNFNSNSSGILGDDDDLLMDFDIIDLLLPESSGSDFVQANNYEMVVNNLEENNDVLGLDAANYPQRSGFDVFEEDTDGPLPMSAFDLESLEKFLGSEEFC